MYGKTPGNCPGLKKTRKLKDNSNINPELLETVERYYNGSMAQEERIPFEERLRTDSAFKTTVEDLRVTLLGIETQALKERLDEFHDEIPKSQSEEKPSTKVRFLSFTKLAVAAGIIIALGMFWMFSGSSNEMLYNKHFKPDPGLPTAMSSSDNFAFYDAMVNYKRGDYKMAIQKWEQLEKQAPQNDTLSYFLGVANLADKNADEAITYLQKTVQNPKSVFVKDANYYLGLAYLKKDNTEDAKKYLKLSNTTNSLELLKRMD